MVVDHIFFALHRTHTQFLQYHVFFVRLESRSVRFFSINFANTFDKIANGKIARNAERYVYMLAAHTHARTHTYAHRRRTHVFYMFENVRIF